MQQTKKEVSENKLKNVTHEQHSELSKNKTTRIFIVFNRGEKKKSKKKFSVKKR